MSNDLTIDEGHPLALELKNLRATVIRYQHDASNAAVKLQRHSLDTSYALERSEALQLENDRLHKEIHVLRAHPDVSPEPITVQELTNALRRVSDKLTVTETTLTDRSVELMNALNDTAKYKIQLQQWISETAIREEESRVLERRLRNLLRAAQEETKMTDLVVQEYAVLVRNLTNQQPRTTANDNIPTNDSSLKLVDNLSEGKLGLRKLLEEFNTNTEKLESEVSRLRFDLAKTQSELQAEHLTAVQSRVRSAELQVALDKLEADDQTAAKMVSRYMKFSQSSNNSLSTALENLKARHQATTATLAAQIDYLQSAILNEKRGSERLRLALDDLTEDISRETYGRRREISLRLSFLGREEHLAENFRRWYRKATECYQRVATSEDVPSVLIAFKTIIEEADGLLDALNGSPALEECPPGALARIIVAQNAVNMLLEELQVETGKRMRLEKQLAHTKEASPPLPVRSGRGSIETPSSHEVQCAFGLNTHMAEPPPSDPKVVELESTKSKVPFVDPPSLEGAVIPSNSCLSQGLPRSPSHIPITFLAESEASPTLPLDPVSPAEEIILPPMQISPPECQRDEVDSKQRLIHELTAVKSRYDDLQHGFRDCHLALKDLSKSLVITPPNDATDILQIAVERLDDFNEDARVELEIRVADEERTTKAFETILQVHGAIGDETEIADVEQSIKAFVDGTDKSVSRVLEQFSRKLEDLTHDIATIKSFLHELPTQCQGSEPSPSSTNWTFLATGSTSRPVSPAQTFGSVMTSLRQKHDVSFTQSHKSSFGDLKHPFAALDLRIPMPSQTTALRRTSVRLRTTSMMSMLGFGSRTNLFSSPASSPRRVSLAHSSVDDGVTTEDEEPPDDVE